jgi:ABC-type multidrug transport system ATPase subunit
LQGIRIITENLSKRFNREWIFRNFSYQFQSGTIYAVTGPNGSGKSTLLQTLAGMIPQTGGAIGYQQDKNAIDVENIYQHLTYAAPYLDLIEEFTLTEHLNFHFSMKKPRNGMSVSDLISTMYLERSANKRVGDFSSGMKQRLKLGLAMFTQSDIIFLDEPGSNLDRTAFEWYYKQLLNLPQDALIFIASNNPEEYPQGAKTLNIAAFK